MFWTCHLCWLQSIAIPIVIGYTILSRGPLNHFWRTSGSLPDPKQIQINMVHHQQFQWTNKEDEKDESLWLNRWCIFSNHFIRLGGIRAMDCHFLIIRVSFVNGTFILLWSLVSVEVPLSAILHKLAGYIQQREYSYKWWKVYFLLGEPCNVDWVYIRSECKLLTIRIKYLFY